MPMDSRPFNTLEKALSGEDLTDFDKVHLVKEAASRNYFNSQQVQPFRLCMRVDVVKLSVVFKLATNCFVSVMQVVSLMASTPYNR